ncbi:hypothetical protein LOZ12_004686 [Ophidiomyces ophidiicola]|uniref:Uncharacterized protein n=1 Tax=Ophidiomyces ophidiicola TaxID=1387563 RepID=A0ACB8USC2_9EURO|nr:uncharacterized protein LOZ57_006526 [Ophidiomyces ophidiicola]KAI1910337.1 hypothetical protein LOZ64_005012 [Ophidiomyces ophidiicola]KAI1937845.1 hypothetical protein LOZ57_006526 [Ophidiomyces ophidiicola]KAI1942379.1 hypothetical protein LOZ62_004600 [Ophidiomyces ophidiicola]KAI2002282.1 hypothetical protein LOZ50_005068 [Ophidiomyces ophidiicola]KAI2021025.1 hypothetical protein LOZ45_004885 [Ophidiomyces ophidiicola]
MPYNTNAIPPPEEATGQSTLPLTRIKKIIRLDEDIAQCSNNAAFLVSVATEMFIQYLTEQSYNVVKSERKPRRNIQYRDLATAVARIDNLEFLSDVIPKTTTYKQFKEKGAREAAEAASKPKGERTLNTGGESRAPREESMVNLDDTGAQSSRAPMVIHSSRTRSSLLHEGPGQDEPVEKDAEMNG